jgi:hypothetical protein
MLGKSTMSWSLKKSPNQKKYPQKKKGQSLLNAK